MLVVVEYQKLIFPGNLHVLGINNTQEYNISSVGTYGALELMCIGRSRHLNIREVNFRRTILVGEMLHLTAPPVVPRDQFIQIAGACLRGLVDYRPAHFTDEEANSLQGPEGGHTGETILETFRILKDREYAPAFTAVSMISHAIIAYGKKGQVSDDAVTKYNAAIRLETNVDPSLNSLLIQDIFDNYGRAITEETARVIFTDMTALVPQTSLKLTTILAQTTNSGMTAALTIKKAVTEHPTFPWGNIKGLFPREIANVILVITTCRDNSYIGFSRNLGEMASTHYKNVAWVAKELLVYHGDAAIKNYLGWTKVPKHRAILQELLDVYNTRRENQEVPNVECADLVAAAALDNP